MVLKLEPITEAIEWIEQRFGPHRRIALTLDGAPLTQAIVEEFVALAWSVPSPVLPCVAAKRASTSESRAPRVRAPLHRRLRARRR